MTTVKQRTKLTPEQKELNRALKKQAEEDARIKREFEAQAALEKFKAELPKRIMNAQALASALGIHTGITLSERGPLVHFYNEDKDNKIYIDDTLSYDSDEWEVEILERSLDEVRAIKEESKRRMEVAQSVYNRLTDDEKQCLKENIVWCR